VSIPFSSERNCTDTPFSLGGAAGAAFDALTRRDMEEEHLYERDLMGGDGSKFVRLKRSWKLVHLTIGWNLKHDHGNTQKMHDIFVSLDILFCFSVMCQFL